jgi:hypothetical protein
MDWVTTAPKCIVVGCDGVAALTETAKGRFWHFESYYCSDCYTALQDGQERQIDRSRLILRPVSSAAGVEGQS